MSPLPNSYRCVTPVLVTSPARHRPLGLITGGSGIARTTAEANTSTSFAAKPLAPPGTAAPREIPNCPRPVEKANFQRTELPASVQSSLEPLTHIPLWKSFPPSPHTESAPLRTGKNAEKRKKPAIPHQINENKGDTLETIPPKATISHE